MIIINNVSRILTSTSLSPSTRHVRVLVNDKTGVRSTFQRCSSSDSTALVPEENTAAGCEDEETKERDEPRPLELPGEAGLVVLREPRVKQTRHVWKLSPVHGLAD